MMRLTKRLSVLLPVLTTSVGFADSPSPQRELKYDDGSTKRPPWCNWLDFSPDGNWLGARYVVSERTERVVIWRTSTWKSFSWTVECTEAAFEPCRQDCAFGPDSNRLYYAALNHLYCKDLSVDKAPQVIRTYLFAEDEYTTHSVQVLRGGDELGILSQRMPNRIRFARVRASDGKQFQDAFKLTAKSSMTAFAANDDGGMIAIGANEGIEASEHVLEIWDTKANKQLFRLNVPLSAFSAAAFDTKGKSLATGNRDGTMRVWDTMTAKITESISEDTPISFVSFHPLERLLAYTTYEKKGANCKIVNLDTGKARSQLNVDSKGASIGRFSRDGSKLATVGGDFTIRVWNVKDILPSK